MKDFLSKIVLITGAATGIGRATAIKFARQGAILILADLDSKVEETVKLVEEEGAEVYSLKIDVSKSSDIQILENFVLNKFDKVDIAFNNAGVLRTGFFTETSEEDFDLMIAVDLKGVWLCMKSQLNIMKEHGGGVIINTASEAGLVGTLGASAYVAAKHGVVGLTKTAAGEYANMGIRVNAIAPGAIETPMVVNLTQAQQQSLLDPQPLQRFGQPEEVADAVLWLASEKASFVTGTILSIDGGATSNAQSYNPALSPKTLLS